MGAQIPSIAEKTLPACGCRKFQIDCLGDHLCTCTTHSGAKKAHDWAVDQITDLFRTRHKVKTQQVIKVRGQHCGDIELAGYLANATGPVPLVLPLTRSESIGLIITIGLLMQYHSYLLLLVRLGGYIANLYAFYSYRIIGKLTAFLQLQELAQSTSGLFHFRHTEFLAQFRSRVDLTLSKSSVLRITLNLDGAPITSTTHTHPSHSQTSRLLTSSLSLGVPVPRATQCM
jgi:hypothetical protein